MISARGAGMRGLSSSCRCVRSPDFCWVLIKRRACADAGNGRWFLRPANCEMRSQRQCRRRYTSRGMRRSEAGNHAAVLADDARCLPPLTSSLASSNSGACAMIRTSLVGRKHRYRDAEYIPDAHRDSERCSRCSLDHGRATVAGGADLRGCEGRDGVLDVRSLARRS